MSRKSICGAAVLAAVLGAFSTQAQTASSLGSNFNGTAISANNWIWFNSHLSSATFSGAAASASVVHVYITGASVSFTDSAKGNTYNIALPDEVLTFDSAASSASLSYTTKWNETVPKSGASNPFLTGVGFQVPASGISGGINPVTMTASFSTDVSGVSLNWQWAAAVYTQWQTNPNNLNVLATDGSGLQSGTPQSMVSYVIGGARGGGGSNYTGSNSATLAVTPQVVTSDPTITPVPETSTWAAVGFVSVAAAGSFWRRRQARLAAMR
jgi:hypothetical protein